MSYQKKIYNRVKLSFIYYITRYFLVTPFGLAALKYIIAFKVKVKHWKCAHYCRKAGARAAIMQAFSMCDFDFKSNSIVIFLYVLENLSSFNQVFFPRCMHFFSQKYAIFLKNVQFFSKICNFFSKICNFSQNYAIFLKNMQFFLKKYALENALNFRIHIKKMQ